MAGLTGRLSFLCCGIFSLLFTVQAQTYQCGGNLTSGSGHIKSQHIPVFALKTECRWLITAESPDNVVHLVLSESTLTKWDQLGAQVLTIYDGDSTDSEVLLISKDFDPRPVVSTGRYVTVVYKGSEVLHTNKKDFVLTYSDTRLPCEVDLRVSEGFDYYLLVTKGHRYSACTWRIHAEENQRINLTVVDAEFPSCNEFLKIYEDFSPTKESLLRTLCDSTTAVFTSLNNEMLLEFHTDSQPAVSTLKLKYTSYTPPPFGGRHETLRGEVYSRVGLITSENFPYLYPERSVYTWSVETEPDFLCVIAYFVDIQYSSGCTKDYLELFDGPDERSPSLGRRCGTELFKQCSSGTNMYIKFYSDNRVTARGFKLFYRTYKRRDAHANFSNTPVWISLLIVSAIGFTALAVCTLVVRRRQRRDRSRPPPYSPPDRSGHEYPVSVVPTPLPSYDDVIKEGNPKPPAYESLDMDTLQVSSGQRNGDENTE